MRALAGVLAVAVAVVGLSLTPVEQADAAVVQWGTNSGTAPNYQATVNGDFVMAGNGVLACQTLNISGAGTCAELHSTSTNAQNVNDNFAMVATNSVSGFTTNSSSAQVTIPAGASVAKAFLSWSANTGSYNVSQTACTAPSTARGTTTLPGGAANGYLTRAAQLRVGSGTAAPTSIAPASVLVDQPVASQPQYYSASADVTSAFAGAATGSPLTVSAGNIWTPTGAGCYAGWSLTVVYDYGSYVAGNAASAPKRVIFYEGHVRQASTDTPLTVAFAGFTAVGAGTRAGFTLFEGDRNITGDTVEYSRASSSTYTQLPNANGATGNYGVGQALGSTRYTQTGTPFTNQSVDVTTNSLTAVQSGDSRIDLRISTSGDSYLLRNAVLSVPTAGLQVDKSADGTADVQSRLAGEPATFTVRLTNSGAGTLQSIVVSDDQADCARTLTGLTLAPQESYTYTCTANGGSGQQYVSTATATARTVAGAFLAEDSDSTTVQVTALALAKTSALAAGATGRAGDTLTYTFTATNSGQSTLTGVAVTDPLPGLSAVSYAWPGAAGTLTGGQAVVATATYVLRQADVDAGSVANTATLVGTDPDGGQQPRASAARTTPLTAAPGLGVTKTGALAAGAAGVVGDRVTWSISFTNNGNVTLTGVALTDSLAGLSTPVVTWPGAAGTLAPGQTATATATSTLTQAQVDAGAVRNTASVTGRTPTGTTTSATSAEAVVTTVAAAPSLVTTKSALVGGSAGVGSTVTYSFSARNSGNVTLTGVSVSDPLPRLSALTPTWPGAAGTLAPGQTVTATATYTLTQADVDAGSVRNTAAATGTAPSGAAVSAVSPQVVTPTAAASPAVTLTKSGTLAAGAAGVAGDTVTYSFVLRNTGNVTLTGASVADPLPGLSPLTYGTWPSGTAGTLAPSQQVTATATYTLRQSDVDAGAVANAATGTAAPPTGAAVSQTRSATVPITPTGALVVTKTGTASGAAGVGSTVTYDFTVRNSGNVTLTQVALVDARAGVSAPTVTWPGPAGTLTPGQTATARATYTITQADVDAGRVPNTASATGRTPQGATVTGTSPQSVVTTQPAAPAVTLGKAGVVQGGAAGAAGDVVRYTFTLRNSGNVTVTGLGVSDPLPGLSALQYAWPATAGTLAPGQTATATASYTVTQADVNAGSVRNTATASGRYGTAPVTATSGEVTTPTAAAQPSVAVTKSGALTNGQAAAAGSTITWSFTLRNTGNVTLTSAGVADSLPGISAVTWGTWPSGAAGTLQPGQTVTGTATSPVTQQDVDAGSVANTATGSGTAPSGAVVRSVAPATVALAAVPGISLGKSGAVTSGTGAVGDTITYTFSARNTGGTTLTGVAVADPAPGLSALTYGTWPGGTAGTLAPGQAVTATATHVVTQADVDAGVVRNTATVSARTPAGDAVAATSPQAVVATAAAAPALLTTKTASNGGGGVGSVVSYAFSARNSGNVTLSGVVVTDPLAGLSALAYSWPGTAGTLRPGQTVTATATYTVTQADVDRGAVLNRSTASGASPSGAAVSAQSAAVTTATVASSPALALTKTGALSGPPAAGSTITYSFGLQNTGNVTLTGATVADPMPGLSPLVVTWPGTPGVLGPDQRATATATRTVTQADVDAGAVANTASASAAPPTGGRVSTSASATVPLPASGALAVEKTGVVTSGTGVAGDVVRFDFVVRNTGAVTVSGIVLADALPGVSTPTITWPGAARTLAPGQQATATATYVVRQSDVDSGSVRNTASVQGTTPAGTSVSAASLPAVVPTAAAAPALDVQKSASSPGDRKVGDVVTYAVSVRNSGNQTVTGVTIVDSLPGLSAPSVTWPGQAGVLAPGQQALATATYVVRQADVDAGKVVNEASASGQAPGGVAVVDSSGQVATSTQAAAPSLAVTKAGAFASGSSGRAGDVVDFTVTLRNTGNQTLTGVTATDTLPGLGALAYGTWPSGTTGTLAPGQAVTATASYTSRQSDLDAGAIANTAEGRGTAPG
uniref:beta strand repeat-containing protein n=1 Tax=uncultured Frigoribacterium sp. TaxID=335377 RepID=UPI0028D0D76B